MKTGSINIYFEEDKTPSIKLTLVNGNLWLTQNELARFFGVFVQKISGVLRSTFRKGLLYEPECTFCNRYMDKGIEKQAIFYNLDVLIFLSFHIESLQADVFREFLKSALHTHLQKQKMEEMKIVWYLPKPTEYWLN